MKVGIFPQECKMKYFILAILFVVFTGCATVPQKADLLIKVPIEGNIVWMSESGNTTHDPYFIINYEDLMKFIEKEKEKHNMQTYYLK